MVEGGVRCNVNHLRTGILVLTLTRECDGQGLTLSVLADHVNSRVLLGDLRADVAVHPFHGGALVRNSTLGHQVVDVVRPVLDGGVATRAFFFSTISTTAECRESDLYTGAVQPSM